MKTAVSLLLLAASTESLRNPHPLKNMVRSCNSMNLRFSESNSNMFGGSAEETPVKIDVQLKEPKAELDGVASSTDKMKEEAAKLRKEAADMEIAMREEARAKGLPEDMINKLIPLRANKPAKKSSDGSKDSDSEAVVEMKTFTKEEVRSKLGYLNTGDAVRMTTELDRVKQKGFLQRWNVKDVSKASYKANTLQFKTKTNIDPIKLKLDDVGFNYQNVFIAALGIATVLGLSSTFIGGELGFILGYLSALLPVTLVGLGSIAPGLIGDFLNRVQYAIDAEKKAKYINMNAGKFLVGYVMGLPISRFNTGGPSNEADFFQIRPTGRGAVQDKQMFARNAFAQSDIARSSVVCIAGSVAECMYFDEGSGTNAGDVNTLYELINTVEPRLSPEAIQDHVRWSAVVAYEVLDQYKEEYRKVCDAFEAGLPLEECIAVLEGTN